MANLYAEPIPPSLPPNAMGLVSMPPVSTLNTYAEQPLIPTVPITAPPRTTVDPYNGGPPIGVYGSTPPLYGPIPQDSAVPTSGSTGNTLQNTNVHPPATWLSAAVPSVGSTSVSNGTPAPTNTTLPLILLGLGALAIFVLGRE